MNHGLQSRNNLSRRLFHIANVRILLFVFLRQHHESQADLELLMGDLGLLNFYLYLLSSEIIGVYHPLRLLGVFRSEKMEDEKNTLAFPVGKGLVA